MKIEECFCAVYVENPGLYKFLKKLRKSSDSDLFPIFNNGIIEFKKSVLQNKSPLIKLYIVCNQKVLIIFLKGGSL